MGKSVQERKAIIDELTGMHLLMTRPLKAGTLRNRRIGSSCAGYSFQIDNLSYRGIWVSTLEDIELTVDGQPVPNSDMLFWLRDLKIPIEDLGGHSEVFWGGRDDGLISVNKVGGLAPGEHKLAIVIKKRADFGHSYGEGAQGYETAWEFHQPMIIEDEAVFTVD